MNVGATFIPDTQPATLEEPRDRPLDNPAVHSQSAAVGPPASTLGIVVHGMLSGTKTPAAMMSLCSVKAEGNLRRPPQTELEVAICDIKESNSLAKTPRSPRIRRSGHPVCLCVLCGLARDMRIRRSQEGKPGEETL